MGVDVSYIVSCYDRPDMLISCLASLRNQTHKSMDIIVTDNSRDDEISMWHRKVCMQFDADYVHTTALTCYHSAEVGAALSDGEFLCFPSDDSYYVPTFAERMVAEAKYRNYELVYCEMLYSPRWQGDRYSVLGVEPVLNRIDKTGFLVRKSVFPGFPDKPDRDVSCAADGLLIERLVKAGVRHGKVKDILAVHN